MQTTPERVQVLHNLVVFFETSACIEYALRISSNASPRYNSEISEFVGFLKVRGIKGVTSETVKRQANGRVRGACSELVGKTSPHKVHEVMQKAQMKCTVRLIQLWAWVGALALESDLMPVRVFYEGLLNNPVTRARLAKVKETHSSRTGLLPEHSDMVILSEAIALQRSGSDQVCFVSKDGDFCEFAQEIKNAFGLRVVHLGELSKLISEIEAQSEEGEETPSFDSATFSSI
jgi:predicted nuclease of predicted toxin-antitoxin system